MLSAFYSDVTHTIRVNELLDNKQWYEFNMFVAELQVVRIAILSSISLSLSLSLICSNISFVLNIYRYRFPIYHLKIFLGL